MSDVQILNCPVDGEQMVRQEHGEGCYHACKSCRGLWIPRLYLLALKRRATQQMKRRPAKPLAPVAHSAQLNCPECSSGLLPRVQDTVPIDVCGQCRAVWLDGDEILQIAKASALKGNDEAKRRRRDSDGSKDYAMGTGFAKFEGANIEASASVIEAVGWVVASLFD